LASSHALSGKIVTAWGDKQLNKTTRNIFGLAILILVLVYYYHAVTVIWDSPNDTQWDFRIYYYAGEAYDQGWDPYIRDNLILVSEEDFWLRFVYPPLTLEFLRFLPQVDYETGCKIWLVLKILTLVAMVFVWKRYFLRDTSLLLIIPIMLFVFDSAVFWDLKTGNISIFEQLLLWLGFAAFLTRRKALFILLILAGSIFKFPLALFMFLLITTKDSRKWWWLAGGLSCMAILVSANYFLRPELFQSFMNNLQYLNERAADYNYSTLAFWEELFVSIKFTRDLDFRMYLVYFSYALTVFAVVLISTRSYFRLRKRGGVNHSVFIILFFCCSYAMVVPRLKSYSFIILIPAFLYLLSSVRTHRFAYLIIPLGLIPVSTPLFEAEMVMRFFHYYPLLLTFFIWLYFNSICYEPASVNDSLDHAGENKQTSEGSSSQGLT